MWKCLVYGRTFRKISTRLACAQKPTCAITTSAPGEMPCRATANAEAAGSG